MFKKAMALILSTNVIAFTQGNTFPGTNQSISGSVPRSPEPPGTCALGNNILYMKGTIP